jgi:hypothetical protein
MLIALDGDYTLWAMHLYGGIGGVDDHHKLQEERPPEDAVVPNVKAGHFERKHLLTLVVPRSTR